MTKKMPMMAKYTRVDAVIECYDVTKQTMAALLEAMPNAYGGDGPGEDDWPEPDHPRDKPYLLSRIWSKLAPEVQADIHRAFDKENLIGEDGE